MKHRKSIILLIATLLLKLVQSVPDWVETKNGNKYLIESRYEYSWFEGLHECSKRNLSLVALDTAEKNDDLVGLLKNRFGTGVDLWIGGTESTAEKTNRKFVWASTGKTFGFSHWQEGEPNNLANNQPCVHTWNISNDFRWADGGCDLKYGYICEETPNHLDLDAKRQAINELNMELSQYFVKMNLELMKKLEQTKLLIDRELDY